MHQSKIYPYKNSETRRRISLWLIMAFLMAVLSGCGAKVKTDQPLPAFSLADLKGQVVSVPQSFTGRAVYLMFFSTT